MLCYNSSWVSEQKIRIKPARKSHDKLQSGTTADYHCHAPFYRHSWTRSEDSWTQCRGSNHWRSCLMMPTEPHRLQRAEKQFWRCQPRLSPPPSWVLRSCPRLQGGPCDHFSWNTSKVKLELAIVLHVSLKQHEKAAPAISTHWDIKKSCWAALVFSWFLISSATEWSVWVRENWFV